MNVKLVWNFSGEGSLKTAEHHLIHLKQYCEKEEVEVVKFGTELVNKFSAISYIIVNQSLVMELRENLKPNQGFLVN